MQVTRLVASLFRPIEQKKILNTPTRGSDDVKEERRQNCTKWCNRKVIAFDVSSSYELDKISARLVRSGDRLLVECEGRDL